MTISWSHSIDGIDWTVLEELYRAAPLGNKSAAGLRTVFSSSRYCCFALEQGRIVGAGRALADGADCSYVCDVAVLPSYQGTGVGREIVARLVVFSRGHKKIILYSVPGKESFHHNLGFLRMLTGLTGSLHRALPASRGYRSFPPLRNRPFRRGWPCCGGCGKPVPVAVGQWLVVQAGASGSHRRGRGPSLAGAILSAHNTGILASHPGRFVFVPHELHRALDSAIPVLRGSFLGIYRGLHGLRCIGAAGLVALSATPRPFPEQRRMNDSRCCQLF